MLARRAKLARYDYSTNNKVLNFGFLGELSLVNPEILFSLEEHNLIPVISPITVGDDGRTYKIDPHDISGALAAVLSATKLIFISDLPGIIGSEDQVLREINAAQITKLINNDNEENADLSSKLRSSLMALEHNTESIHIINGKIPHALMLQLFTEDSVGTTIVGNQQQNS
jgi:acetylglutamate kinase